MQHTQAFCLVTLLCLCEHNLSLLCPSRLQPFVNFACRLGEKRVACERQSTGLSLCPFSLHKKAAATDHGVCYIFTATPRLYCIVPDATLSAHDRPSASLHTHTHRRTHSTNTYKQTTQHDTLQHDTIQQTADDTNNKHMADNKRDKHTHTIYIYIHIHIYTRIHSLLTFFTYVYCNQK